MDINIGEGLEVIELSDGESTPGEDLGELVATIHLQQQMWDIYLKQIGSGSSSAARDRWSDITTERDRLEFNLWNRMRKESLAQVVTTGFKARREFHKGKPFLAIYRITDEGEERWTV